MAREVSVATQTTRRRSAKSGRTVRFIGNAFFREQLVVLAKFGNGSMVVKILGFGGSVSDPSLSSETLGIGEGGEEENGVWIFGGKCCDLHRVRLV